MSYEEYQGTEQSVHDHPDHNFKDRVQLAGDVVPLPITPGPNAGRPTSSESLEGIRQSIDKDSNVTSIVRTIHQRVLQNSGK